MDYKNLPALNALLNSTAFIFLLWGGFAIKRGDRVLHKKMMISAFVVSSLFLVSYLSYHYLSPGVTKYAQEGFIRYVYFTILISHTLLAPIIPPLAITAVYHALKGNFPKHKKVVRWLYPGWMYVSITGVIIYLMLYVFS